MVRKQVYLEPRQDEKVKRLAKTLACTEADVIRQAIDRLPDPERSPEELLRAAGALVSPPPDAEALVGMQAEDLERDVQRWAEGLARPLGLADAVLAERR